MEFSNKNIIITGASSGIGAATAIMFAKNSANVILVGRNETNLQETAQKCEEYTNTKVLIVKADITIDEDVERIVTETINKFGGIDILVNCAGYAKLGGIFDGIDLFDKMIAANVRGAYLLTSKAVPYIVKRKGNIVNVSSITAVKCLKHANLLAYSMSKAALNQFTRCLALELSKDGVRVNAVSPGATKTPFFEVLGYQKAELDNVFENIPTALGKIVNSEEVADLILFLASDRARSITGGIYTIDNGENLI